MKKNELIDECHYQGLPAGDLLKPELEKSLKEHLSGTQHVPALSFNSQKTPMEHNNLGMYEVAPSESLHDLKGHIRNLWQELPYHLNDQEKERFLEVKEALLTYKSNLRGLDYRLSAIVMYKHMEGKMHYCVQELLYTLAQLCHLLYIQDHERTPKIILRLHNTAFKNAMSCKQVLGVPQSVTLRTLYGIYWHSIIAEAPLLTRIVSLRTICTEEQERTCNTIKEITKATSSGHSDHIIPNSLLRMQAENVVREKPVPTISSHSIIGKYAKTLPPSENTSFFKTEVNCYEYQAHIERISDFLLPGKDVWWHFDNDIDTIIFDDGSAEPDERLEGPRLNHFRSWTLASERTYLKNCWQKCLDSSVSLPISRVKTYDTNGEPTGFIVHVKDLMTNACNKGDLHDTTEMSDESGSSNQSELLDNSTSEENDWDDDNITLHMTALSNVSDHMEDDCLVAQDMAEEIPQFYHDHNDIDQSKDCQTTVNQEVSSHNDINQHEMNLNVKQAHNILLFYIQLLTKNVLETVL